MVSSLNRRAGILEKISALPEPTTREEREALEQVVQEYRRLLNNFREAVNELNDYLKKQKPSASS